MSDTTQFANQLLGPDGGQYHSAPQNRLARLAMNDPDTGAPLLNYPASTARVPPDRMRDTPYYASVPPDLGDQTTAPVLSNQDLAAAQTLARMRQLSDQMASMSSGAHDPAAFDQLMQEFNALDAAHRAYTNRGRAQQVAITQHVPADADVMMQAMQRRQALGRNEQ